MRSGVSLQVERIVKSFAAECAQVTFHVGMAFQVAIQQTGQTEALEADCTAQRILLIHRNLGAHLQVHRKQRIFKAVTAVHELDGRHYVDRQTETLEQVVQGALQMTTHLGADVLVPFRYDGGCRQTGVLLTHLNQLLAIFDLKFGHVEDGRTAGWTRIVVCSAGGGAG